jgi:hypothetical protein
VFFESFLCNSLSGTSDATPAILCFAISHPTSDGLSPAREFKNLHLCSRPASNSSLEHRIPETQQRNRLVCLLQNGRMK